MSIFLYCFFISLLAISIALTVAIYRESNQLSASVYQPPPSSIPSAYSVLQILGRHLGLLHVERLLGKLCELPLVHLLLLQQPHSPLCHGRLPNRNRNQDQ
jgi:hypothetical protein